MTIADLKSTQTISLMGKLCVCTQKSCLDLGHKTRQTNTTTSRGQNETFAESFEEEMKVTTKVV